MNPTVIRGQKVNRVKLQRAKELRQAMTPAEKFLWGQLRANRLGGFHFRRQQVIEGFIADFYCHRARLIIEVDGKIHAGQQDWDRERDRILTDKGLQIMRIAIDTHNQPRSRNQLTGCFRTDFSHLHGS